MVAFEQNEQLQGLEFLSGVIDAAVNYTPLIITYKTYKGKEIISTLHPYHVSNITTVGFCLAMKKNLARLPIKH